ncbi:single-stranded DNA-binding protein [bacterium]|nr:single-stranded DNA-binding protein [bacterium]
MHDLRMPDINTILIAGNLTRDPAFRKTTNGTPVTNFWIASNRRFRDNTGQWRENVCYVGIVAWYKLAENCANNLKKGSAVIIEGELQSRSLKADDGRNRNIVEIKARRVQFLNRREITSEQNEDEYNLNDEDTDFFSMNSDDTTEVDSVISDAEHKDEHSENMHKGRFDFGLKGFKL